MAIDPYHQDITKQEEMFLVDQASQPRVFVTQETSLDLVKATRFGELVALVPQNLNVVMNSVSVLNSLYDGLAGYTPNDFLLPTGDPVIIGLAFTVAAEISRGHLRVLKWDRQINDYYSVLLNLNDR